MAIVLFVIAARQLGETAPRHDGAALTLRRTLSNYARVLRHPVSIGYALVVALGFGCLFAYVSGSSLVLIGLLGASQRFYGLLFACTALGLMAGSFTNARLSRRGASHTRIITVGLSVIATTTSWGPGGNGAAQWIAGDRQLPGRLRCRHGGAAQSRLP